MYHFLSKVWDKLSQSLPRTLNVFSHFGEGYPVFSNADNLYFVACAPPGISALSLEGLISGFDCYVWIFILVSASITKMISYVVEKYLAMIRKSSFHYRSSFFTLKILLGEQTNLAVFKRKHRYTPLSLFCKKYPFYYKGTSGQWSRYSTLGQVDGRQKTKVHKKILQSEYRPSTDEEISEATHEDYFVPKMVQYCKVIFLAEFSVTTNMYVKMKR